MAATPFSNGGGGLFLSKSSLDQNYYICKKRKAHDQACHFKRC